MLRRRSLGTLLILGIFVTPALGQDKEAVEAFIRAVRLRPDYAEAFVNLGSALRRYGRHDESVKSLKEAIRILPEHPKAHMQLGATYIETQAYGDAMKELQRALEIDGNLAEARYHVGVLQLRLNDRNAAFEAYKLLQPMNKELAERLFKEIYG